MNITTRLEIGRSVPEVFAFVADQRNAPQWQTGLHEVRQLTDGPIGVGTEHEFVRTFAGRRITARNRYVAFEPNRYVEFEIPSGWMTGTASYQTDSHHSGRTVLTSKMKFQVRRPLSLQEPLLARILRKETLRDEQRLKNLLESGDPSTHQRPMPGD